MLKREWQARSGDRGMPFVADCLRTVKSAYDQAREGLATFVALTAFPDHKTAPLDAVQAWLDALVGDFNTPHRLPRRHAIEKMLADRGVTPLLQELRVDNASSRLWPDRFDAAWLRSCLDDAYASEPELAAFVGRTHDQLVEEFRQLDQQSIRSASDRVRRAHAEHVVAARNANPEQDALVRREVAKARRHKAVRSLVKEASDVLMALCPCWMASPLSVSQLLPADRQYFDVVIFDEASQVLPEDAVAAISRGRQVVVAGDRHQLPPTTFFAAGVEDSSEEDFGTEGFESLLDGMSACFDPAWGLDWHYRSRDESLVAFSNEHFYDKRLVTFPGVGGEARICHELVSQSPTDIEEESSSAEVRRVVELVLDHARKRPDETLGVIALGLKHALRVEAAIDRARLEHPDLDDFFDRQRFEHFFVKNLERVQGDEREAIILSVGYGKDSAGKLLYRFGPLLQRGGERRLNVAVTRARSRVTLVSSFSHLDMDPNRSSARGVQVLRAYLEYAASGGTRHPSGQGLSVPLNDFEQSVADALAGRGVSLVPQWGVSQYRIDLVAQHPKQPGRFVLAIECDGASYHSSPTARDRDRLRQEHLEALGWRFHRIWSTDWFMRREQEIARSLVAFETAVNLVDRAADGNARSASATGAPRPDEKATVAPQERGPRPPIPQHDQITDYSWSDIDAIVRWVMRESDFFTDDEIVGRAREALGFTRRGSRIENAIRASISRVRRV